MTNLNPLQEALLAHVSKEEHLAAQSEDHPGKPSDLEVENAQLRARVAYLEMQIATHAFGGWQLH